MLRRHTFRTGSTSCGRVSYRAVRSGVVPVGAPLRSVAGLESLEDRTLLTTTLFLDFGAGLGMNGTMSSSVDEFKNIFGPGNDTFGGAFGTGSDMTDFLNATDSLDFRPLQYDFDGNGTLDDADVTALANAVLPIVQRALEPFDIDVIVGSAATLADAATAVGANAGDVTGQFDAYNFIMDITSNGFGGGSVGDNGVDFHDGGLDAVGDNAGLFGIAGADDLLAQFNGGPNQNLQDEATLTFSDVVFGSVTSATGTAAFNDELATRIAYTATHEAFHTLTALHTTGLTASGDVIRLGSVTRGNPFMVTRFDLNHQGPSAEPSNYNLIANDPDIGLRDGDRDGIPDLAFVSGTGAHDRITLTLGTGNTVNVAVSAYNDSGRTSLIGTETYSIDLSTDTEGIILIDGGINADLIEIDASIAADIRVRGGTGLDGLMQEGDRVVINDSEGGTFVAAAGGGTFTGGNGRFITINEVETVTVNSTTPPVSASVIDAGVDEGAAGETSFLNFEVRLFQATTRSVTVDYTTANGSAVAGSDFIATSGTVTFAVGETSKFVRVAVTGDNLVEGNERAYLLLTDIFAGSGVAARITRGQATGIIYNDDAADLRVSDAVVREGDSGQSRFLEFTVTLSRPVDAPISARFRTFDGQARAGVDYVAADGRITFNPGGSLTRLVRVAVIGDTGVERNETLSLRLSELGNLAGRAVAFAGSGVGTILNDDSALVTVSDAVMSEGNSGDARFLEFTVFLTDTVDAAVAVTYLTFDGSAQAGSDYRRSGGRITFNPGGSTSRRIRVALYGDDVVERDETLSLRLSALANPAGRAVAIGPSGVGTIRNDDSASLTVSDASTTEGRRGQTQYLDFTITLSQPVDAPVTVTYLTYDGSAKAGSDFRNTGGRTTFNPGGSTTRLIRVAVYGDDMVERNETMSLRLSNLSRSGRAAAFGGSGVGTIVNDESSAVAVSSPRVVEGRRGQSRYLDFVVSLTNPVDVPVSVTFLTFDGSAKAGSDYRRTGGRITFNPGGSTTRLVRVEVYGDDTPERQESMSLRLSNLAVTGRPVSIGGSGVGTILTDDGRGDTSDLFANGLADSLM